MAENARELRELAAESADDAKTAVERGDREALGDALMEYVKVLIRGARDDDIGQELTNPDLKDRRGYTWSALILPRKSDPAFDEAEPVCCCGGR